MFRRSDGDLVRDVPLYRRALAILLRTRTEAHVLFEQRIDATAGLAFIESWNAAHPGQKISFFDLVVRALVLVLEERPRLNRFTVDGRLYQRRGIWIAFSAKKALDDDSPVVALKRRFEATASFDETVARLRSSVSDGKSEKKSLVDRELSLLFSFPHFIAKRLVRLTAALDRWNLLPAKFIESDPMFASAFVVNLGSVKLDAAYHHNFEYGTVPVFCTVGRLHDAVHARPDGSVGTRKEVLLRFTYDERVEDGLYCARALDRLRERLESPTGPG